MIHDLIVAAWEQERLPAEWIKSLLVPVYKAGDLAVLDNYRGISLISVPCKVFSLIRRLYHGLYHGLIHSSWSCSVASDMAVWLLGSKRGFLQSGSNCFWCLSTRLGTLLCWINTVGSATSVYLAKFSA